jgi:hypothetical protein
MADGLARMLAMPALASASPDLQELVRRVFMSGGYLAYSIQQVAARQAVEQKQPERAAQLLCSLALEMHAFHAEAEAAHLVAAAGQVH